MKETIERLRAARAKILEVEDQLAEVDLRYAAEDIQTSIDELEKVQALAEQFGARVRVVLTPHPRKVRCTCGTVDVSSGLKGYVERVPGRIDLRCPIHGEPVRDV
jgi:hypothetical protein